MRKDKADVTARGRREERRSRRKMRIQTSTEVEESSLEIEMRSDRYHSSRHAPRSDDLQQAQATAYGNRNSNSNMRAQTQTQTHKHPSSESSFSYSAGADADADAEAERPLPDFQAPRQTGSVHRLPYASLPFLLSELERRPGGHLT